MNHSATTSPAPLAGEAETPTRTSALECTHLVAPAAEDMPMSPARCFLTNGSRTMAHAIAWYSLCLETMLKQTGVQVPEEPGLMEYGTRLWLEMMRFVSRTPGWSQNKAEILLLIDRIMGLALEGKQ